MEKKEESKFKIMPHSIEAEQSVLGAMMINNEVPIDVVNTLKESDFYARAHAQIFAVMQELYRANRPIDFVTLTDALEKSGQLEEVGGIEYLTALTNVLPSAANYKHYVEIVKRDSVFRKVINCGRDITEKGYNANDREELLKFAEKQIFDISEQEDVSNLEHIDNALKQVIDKFDAIAKDPNCLRGLPTGFEDLDKVTNGLQNSDLILIAARPGAGKTSLAMNIANHVALSGKKNVAIFSLEMPKIQLAQRSVCSIAGVSMEKALKGKLSVDEWKAMLSASKKLSEANIFIDDSSMTTPIDILSKCRRIKREKGLDLIMIDYLQLMTTGNKKVESRQLEISEMTRMLKIAARELNVPILLLSQLSRAVDSRQDHRPILSDLRESGAIEQDADIVMFVYRPDLYNDSPTEEPGVCEIIVAKHRNGPLATIKVRWIGETTSFANLSYKPKKVAQQDPQTVLAQTFEDENYDDGANEFYADDAPPPADDELPPFDMSDLDEIFD